MRKLDLIGKTFGSLSPYEMVMDEGNHVRWKCKCACGSEVTVRGSSLKRGDVKSCGCHRSGRGKSMLTKHGMYYHVSYGSWSSMMGRCYQKANPKYPDYGGRGIKVCERWHDVKNFIEDMGEKPKGSSIDRIDNNGDYEPENCRWTFAETQANNTRRTILIEHEGKVMGLSQWAREKGIGASTIRLRMKNGLTGEALFQKPENGVRYEDRK